MDASPTPAKKPMNNKKESRRTISSERPNIFKHLFQRASAFFNLTRACGEDEAVQPAPFSFACPPVDTIALPGVPMSEQSTTGISSMDCCS